jgi:hypothetical protein
MQPQAGLKLIDPPTSAFLVLGLQNVPPYPAKVLDFKGLQLSFLKKLHSTKTA